MLHQLGMQQAERETPAEAHITSVVNTSMQSCKLFHIETRQTLQVQVETKSPDVVAAFSVKHRTTVWSLKVLHVHFCSTLTPQSKCLVFLPGWGPQSSQEILGWAQSISRRTYLVSSGIIFWTAESYAAAAVDILFNFVRDNLPRALQANRTWMSRKSYK